MYKQLAALYHKLSGFPPVAWAGNKYLQGLPIGNLVAYLRMKKQRTNRGGKTGPIVVVFVQQHKAGWDIVRDLYECMLKDASFKTYLISMEEPNDDDRDAAHRLLVELYGAENVVKADKDSVLFDLQSLNPDYVFLPRPYDQYLPKQYRSSSVAKYASVSYIPYGMTITKTLEKDAMLGRFFRNVSMFFADSSYTASVERARHPRSHAKGIRRTIESGMPYLSSYAKLRGTNPDVFRILWTPRWGEEAELGGSNFMPFKDRILQYMEQNPDTHLTFRPHPYLFEHFVKTGKLTKAEADAYLDHFKKSCRLEYDYSPDLRYAFARSSVLVTDISSIIAPYFMTGKPIIFCETGATMNPLGSRLRDAMYVANSFEDVVKHLENLKRGIDPLSEMRTEVATEQLFIGEEESSSVIMRALIEDRLC